MIEQFIDKDKIMKLNTSHISSSAAFRLASNILEKWSCSDNEKQKILGLSKSNYHRYLKDNNTVILSSEQLERISYLVNISESLKVMFNNKENVFGFMRMKNDNPYFCGRSPISMICNGSTETLNEVFKQINAMISV